MSAPMEDPVLVRASESFELRFHESIVDVHPPWPPEIPTGLVETTVDEARGTVIVHAMMIGWPMCVKGKPHLVELVLANGRRTVALVANTKALTPSAAHLLANVQERRA